MGPKAVLDGCGKSHAHRDSIPRPSRLYRVAIPTELSRPTPNKGYRQFFSAEKKRPGLDTIHKPSLGAEVRYGSLATCLRAMHRDKLAHFTLAAVHVVGNLSDLLPCANR